MQYQCIIRVLRYRNRNINLYVIKWVFELVGREYLIKDIEINVLLFGNK